LVSDNGGRRLLSGAEDGMVKLWDVASGREMHTMRAHSHAVKCVTFSPDGEWFATASGEFAEWGEVKVWRSENGALVHTLPRFPDRVNVVTFLRDGRSFVTGSQNQNSTSSKDDVIKIWDVATGELLRSFPWKGDSVADIALSPDGTELAASRYAEVRIWDIASGKETRRLEGHPRFVNSVAYSPDGQRVVSGGDDPTIRVWDIETRSEVRSMHGIVGAYGQVSFSPDGCWIVADDGTEIHLFDGRPVTSEVP
jgi:WD40 repeat protein